MGRPAEMFVEFLAAAKKAHPSPYVQPVPGGLRINEIQEHLQRAKETAAAVKADQPDLRRNSRLPPIWLCARPP